MKWMKTMGKWILLLLIGLTVSAFSMFVQVGTDDSGRETIGIQKKWGFPISYRTTAPGSAWADYNGIRFAGNSAVWTIGLAAVVVAGRRIKRGSNQASHATSEPARSAASSAREG